MGQAAYVDGEARLVAAYAVVLRVPAPLGPAGAMSGIVTFTAVRMVGLSLVRPVRQGAERQIGWFPPPGAIQCRQLRRRPNSDAHMRAAHRTATR